MSKSVPAIRSVKARGLVVPISRPVKNAFGVIDAAPMVLIDVETDQGVTGHAYIFAYANNAEAAGLSDRGDRARTRRQAGRALRPDGGDGCQVPPARLAGTGRHGRLRSRHGLLGRARPGRRQPVVELLGGSPRPIKAYDSYGVVDPIADEKALRRSLEQGFRGIKIKGGDGDAANDERMVKGVRALLGPDVALMIDFNQSLDPAEATRRIARLAPYDLHWIEEPVPQRTCSATRKCARPRRRRSRPARTGGSRAALPKRSQPAPATSSCPT